MIIVVGLLVVETVGHVHRVARFWATQILTSLPRSYSNGESQVIIAKVLAVQLSIPEEGLQSSTTRTIPYCNVNLARLKRSPDSIGQAARS